MHQESLKKSTDGTIVCADHPEPRGFGCDWKSTTLALEFSVYLLHHRSRVFGLAKKKLLSLAHQQRAMKKALLVRGSW